ncbi:metal ABC transporter substrate-binding protein [Roseomonas elaeocarpi]|uniref:Metal ABC transporter substrate-binding protein n=1 Tax=Roseomonas elaeocarpi TaxID=907779 RepID=A0ABV6JZ39_9PROT
MQRRSLLPLLLAPLAAGALPRPLLAQTQAPAAATTPLPVVASFSILGDLAAQVGGSRIAVRTLVGPDGDAHTYQPRPSDAAAIREARLVLRNGLNFEPWLDRLIRSAGTKAQVVTAAEGVATRRMTGEDGHGHDSTDPHAWQNIANARIYLRNIAAALAAADPEGAETYRANASSADSRLAALDEWVRAQVATVPAERRIVITSHDAFGYFGAAYGITFEAPQGMSTESEPSAAQVAALIRQVRARHVTAVFVENMTNPATLDRLAKDAGVTVRGELFSDALSRPGEGAETYEAMMRHNVGLLVPAMRGG